MKYFSRLSYSLMQIGLIGLCALISSCGTTLKATAPVSTPGAVVIQTVITQTVSPNATPESAQPASFVLDDWPAAGSTIRLSDYRKKLTKPGGPARGRGVGVEVSVDEVAVPPYSPDSTIPSRSSLYVDGQSVSKDTESDENGANAGYSLDSQGHPYTYDAGPWWISWTPDLTPGSHEARYHVVSNDGRVLDYTWQFMVSNN